MSMNTYKAMVITETEERQFKKEIIQKSIQDLPEGDILIQVKYSSLNYKDALSATGNKGVTRHYPHTPGIDAAGIVIESSDHHFSPKDQVLVTGFDLGMNTSGGYGQYIRVPKEWVVKLPPGLNLKESMIYGTAGFTAALSVYKLILAGVKKTDGDILVTGATGGVASIAISLLAKLGYKVIASTGKLEEKDSLIALGAKDIIDRNEQNDDSNRPLVKPRWAGVIDTVGGNILATAIKSTNYGGVVTSCGNVASHEFSSSVYPFILRGVSLIGIDSVLCPMETRVQIWKLLATKWKPEHLDQYVTEVSLDNLEKEIDTILNGKHKGRTIVNLDL